MAGFRQKTALLLLILAPAICHADIDGVPWVDIEVDGTTYSVPGINQKVRENLYFLKKSLKGDKEARKILLGGQKERYLFIGDGEKVLWLKVTENDEEVIHGA